MDEPDLHKLSKEELLHYAKKIRNENRSLKNTQSTLGAILEEIPLIIYSIDKKGIFTYSDGKALEQLELKPGQVVGLNAFELYKKRPDIIDLVQRALKGENVRATITYNDRDFDSIYRPIRDENGNILKMVGLSVDITEHNKAVEELDRFFKATLALLCTADLNGYFTKINPAFEKILGYSKKELLEKPFLDYVHPDDIESTLAEMKQLEKGSPTLNFNNRYLCKDGSYKWLNWLSVPHNKVIYASAIDITELKDNEQKMELLLHELERSNQDLEQFAYVSSHDLQEPLRKIKNYGELFVAKYGSQLDEGASRYMDIITRAAGRMQTLIDDLLEFSRINTKGKDPEKTDMNNVLANVLDNLEYSIKTNNAQINTIGNLPEIDADESQMAQVFQNLISNSIKFKANNDPVINISTEKRESEWLFKITDNGIGFDMQYADKIFTVFQRLHSTQAYKGTGIGLALCKKIIERHYGKIWAESEEGAGTAFFFTIPFSSPNTDEQSM